MSPTRPHARPRKARPARNRGFTLIELIMVVVIIAALLAILLPAIGSIRTKAIEAGVRTEINSLEQALAQFKSVYGTDAPSRLVIWERGGKGGTANSWDDTGAETIRSKAIIRQIWPQFDFSKDRAWLDGDPGLSDTVLAVNSGEAMTFFLGGICTWQDANGDGYPSTGDLYSPTGFSKNPADPFATGGNREGPFLEFAANRFVNLDSAPTARDPFPEYVDSLPGQQTPYAYLSAYGGKGYQIVDLGIVPGGNNLTSPYYNYSGPPGGYYKPQTYQIISPGWDGQFGPGGCFDTKDPYKSLHTVGADGQPGVAGTNDNPTDNSTTDELLELGADGSDDQPRLVEHDNITNFNEGRLNP